MFTTRKTLPLTFLCRLALLTALTWPGATMPAPAQSSPQPVSGVEIPGSSSISSSSTNQPAGNNQVMAPNYWGDAKNMSGGQYGTYRNPYTGGQPGSNGQALNYRPNTQGLGGSASHSGRGGSSMFSPMRMGMMGLGAASLGMRGMSRMTRRTGSSSSAREEEKLEERRRKQEEKMRKELAKAQKEAEERNTANLNSQASDLPKKRVEGDLLGEKDSF